MLLLLYSQPHLLPKYDNPEGEGLVSAGGVLYGDNWLPLIPSCVNGKEAWGGGNQHQ